MPKSYEYSKAILAMALPITALVAKLTNNVIALGAAHAAGADIRVATLSLLSLVKTNIYTSTYL